MERRTMHERACSRFFGWHRNNWLPQPHEQVEEFVYFRYAEAGSW
jgi:hypothetical protein